MKTCLGDQFRPVRVVGEVTNCRQPRGGHLYFTLRDRRASLRVVVFASTLARLPTAIREGEEAIAEGRVTAYPRSGDLQLVADWLEPAGEGAIRAAREALRRKLAGEGLLDPERKKPLPFLPRSIGVVTSPTSAAIRDVLSTIERRFPNVRIVIAPCRVSGPAASPGIARALGDLDCHGRTDLILLVRGGGSQEDLSAFDAEVVARAIAAARTPVLTGVGHETDVTIADLVADRRAPTPTAAAELAVPVRADLLAELARREARLHHAVSRRLEVVRRRLSLAARAHALASPSRLLAQQRDRLEARAKRLAAHHPQRRLGAARAQLAQEERRLAHVDPRQRVLTLRELLERNERRLVQASPSHQLRAAGSLLQALEVRLRRLGRRHVAETAVALGASAARLESVSPLTVLARGYSVTTDASGSVIREAGAVAVGDTIRARLATGHVEAQVTGVFPSDS